MEKKSAANEPPGTGLNAAQGAALAAHFETRPPEELLQWAFDTYGVERVPLSCSFSGPAGLVLLHMGLELSKDFRVFTVDTGRLPPETYELIDTFSHDFDVTVEVLYPPADLLSALVRRQGINGFYRSTTSRLLCCHVRKELAVQKFLQSVPAWLTGLRRTPGTSRQQVPKVEIDSQHGGILKLNPLADWSGDQVWGYLHEHDVPYNRLHDQGYKSIGCAPCSRPVSPGEDARAGRWWWEQSAPKECGLHYSFNDQQLAQQLKELYVDDP